MRRARFGLLSLLFWATIANGYDPDRDPVPPRGKRVYLIDEKDPYKKVEIRPDSGKDSTQKGIVLRDPVLPGQRPQPSANTAKRAAPRKPKQAFVPTSLPFSKLTVEGRLVSPRVRFARRVLDIGQVEEPVKADFFNKITDRGFPSGL
jgi:hypothetical protein